MIRSLAMAALLMVAVGAFARWNDRLHLVAAGLAAVVIVAGALAIGALRRHSTPEDADGYLDEGEPGLGSGILRDGIAGLAIGGLGLALTATLYAYVLPPFYPLLVGDCPQILPKLAAYEEAEGWPQAVKLIDTRLARPIDKACRTQLAERKCRYLIEWSKTLPREEAERKLVEAEQWAEANQLANYRTIARLMREQLQPTPTPAAPVVVTPTPTPAPTPVALPAGASVQLSGLDAAYFPPTVFAYLRVVDQAGQPLMGLAAKDVRVTEDGRPVASFSLAHFSQAPAPLSIALVIDYSGSMEGEPLAAAKGGARALLDLLGANDQVEIIGFNDKVQLLQAWTGDKRVAGEALDQWSAKDRTALWDALWLAASDLAGRSGRKVVVLLTDGADNQSQHTVEEVVAQARRVGLSLFVIGLRSTEYNGGTLEALVREVGGRYTEANSPGELEAYYRQVAGAIRNEYRLALTLSRPPDKATHRLRIEVGGPQPLVVEQTYLAPSS